ncbi:VOC family protein [Halobacillus sp. A5]|uniref:VOC family protein n=1 Tax=Halobacillus sp. A5 TaxID=2880263 RepID=UPI0020A6A663|nr:VOC family protein [Halobacillus sp. A5]MCP3028027.1 VOC family protein [Halobacillus sp. A5]
MKQHVTPYLTFNGNAREAISFYQNVFGGEIADIQSFGEANYETPPGMEERIMHARLQNGSMLVMFSDNFSGTEPKAGSQISLALELNNKKEIEELYLKLKEEGTAEMELQDTFWGATFAKVTDKFGITWDLNLHNE